MDQCGKAGPAQKNKDVFEIVETHQASRQQKKGPDNDQGPGGWEKFVVNKQNAPGRRGLNLSSNEWKKVVDPLAPKRNDEFVFPYPPIKEKLFLIGLPESPVRYG